MLTQNPVECKSYCRKIAGVRKIRDEEMEGGRVRETESEDGRRGGGGKDEGDGEEGKEKKHILPCSWGFQVDLTNGMRKQVIANSPPSLLCCWAKPSAGYRNLLHCRADFCLTGLWRNL